MSTFGDIEGVHFIADDMIIVGTDEAEHVESVRKLLDRARASGVTFNRQKIQWKVSAVRFMGHVVSAGGLKADREKVQAIVDMSTPTSKADLQHAPGVITYLSHFILDMSEITTPLRYVLKKDSHWQWQPEQAAAFSELKQAISSAPVLKLFDPSRPSVVQADTSSTGLGACLLQDGRPVAYASPSLSAAEENDAQIEKEMLGVIFALEKFHHYVYGYKTEVQTDHQPPVTIVKKPLYRTSPRLQLMPLRLMRDDVFVKYVPGKLLYIPDTVKGTKRLSPDV